MYIRYGDSAQSLSVSWPSIISRRNDETVSFGEGQRGRVANAWYSLGYLEMYIHMNSGPEMRASETSSRRRSSTRA